MTQDHSGGKVSKETFTNLHKGEVILSNKDASFLINQTFNFDNFNQINVNPERMNNVVRAKFRCDGVVNQQIALSAVVDGSEENKEFWKYTPAGVIRMHIDNQQALEKFEVGKEYYVDFIQAE